MKNAMLAGADLSDLEEAAGPTSYARGLTYARKHAVVSMRWDEGMSAVRGRVQGSHGEVYTTTAYFGSGYGSALGSRRASAAARWRWTASTSSRWC